MPSKGRTFIRLRTPEQIKEEENRKTLLRSLAMKAGGHKAYAAKVGMSTGTIANMIQGGSRVSDRALGIEKAK